MKKIIPIIIGTLALASCGSKTVYVTNTEAPDTTVKVTKTTDAPIATPAPTTPVTPAWSEEDEFLSDIESSYGGYISVSDQDMIDVGWTTCDALLSGASGTEVVWAISSVGGDTEFITTVVASAVANFCPSQMYKFGN